jgi:hypothetical protein
MFVEPFGKKVDLTYLLCLSSPYYKNKATGETSWHFPKPTNLGASKKGGVGSGGRSGENDPEPGAQI